MTDDQMDDLKHFFETTINNKIRPLEEGLEALENKMDQRFEEVNQRFEEVNQRFEEMNQRFEEAAEVQNQILNAVGERFDNHEQRIIKLEKQRPAGGALKFKPAA